MELFRGSKETERPDSFYAQQKRQKKKKKNRQECSPCAPLWDQHYKKD